MFFDPAEIAHNYIESGRKKLTYPLYKTLVLSILAGAFIAFAAQGSNVAVHTISSAGIAKALAGALFTTGLMMVVITGAELFTGNTLIVVSCMAKKTRRLTMFKNWLIVYFGNFIGSLIIVLLIVYSGQLDLSGGLLGGFTLKVAAHKTGLTFSQAFFLGILCNWLVCLAVWMASAAKDIAGKLLAIFFPIWLFVTSGFEHSVANMYYIPAGILAKLNPDWVSQAIALGVTPEKIEQLTWGAFIVYNAIPVTLGNIIGGSVFVGMMYWLGFIYNSKQVPATEVEDQRMAG
ncbi:MAG: formate/nitrite transporter family protein [Peptococcaceae bacterium]|nr:formate/nitrite transporter family protein [Peptococcaceae bacterium]